MAYIEPNSELRLLAGINIDQDYNHTLFFNSREKQATFFKSRTVKTFDKLSYQRKERGYIRVNCVPEEVYGCNYMMYKNTNFDPQNLERWIYCFVESIEYINNNCAEIRYTVDRMQTWMFDYKLGDCLVDREHTLTDELDQYITPEPVVPFEDTINAFDATTARRTYDKFAATVILGRELKTIKVLEHEVAVDYTTYNPIGMTTGDYYAYVGIPIGENALQEISDNPSTYLHSALIDLKQFLFLICGGQYTAKKYASFGTQSDTGIEDIVEISIYPIDALKNVQLTADGYPRASVEDVSVLRPVKFQYSQTVDYTPRNAKLLSSPYTKLVVSDLSGNNANFKYELFSGTEYGFKVQSNIIGAGQTSISPANYRSIPFYALSTVTLTHPLSVFYQNSNVNDYIRNNKLSMVSSAISTGLSLVGGAVQFSAAKQAASSLSSMGEQYGDLAQTAKSERRKQRLLETQADLNAESIDTMNKANADLSKTVNQSLKGGASDMVGHVMGMVQSAILPNKVYGGSSDGNTTVAFNRDGFIIYAAIPVLESAQQIDDYFDRFGYKLLTTHRPYVDEAKTNDRPVSDLRGVWNYIKTVDCVVHHSNPDSAAIGYSAQDEAIIASIYNKGITFWFDNEKIGDYNNYRNANSIFNPQPGPTPPPVPTTKNGIDISRVNVNCYWNDEIDNWSPVTAFDMESVKNSGGDYAILRIGGADEYGDTTDVQQGFYFDGAFESSYLAARAAGLKVGAYYIVNCMTVQEAVAEVNHIVSLFQQFDYPVLEGGFWLDIELNAVPEGKSRRFTSASASVQNAMIAELKAGIVNGIAPYAETFVGLYTNPSGLEHYGFKSLPVYAQTPLWLAYWTDYYDKGNPPEYILEKIRQLPDYPAIWQYGQNKLGVRAYNGTLVDGDYIYPPGWTPSQQ